MAINTAQKRASVATVSMIWNGPSVIADGGFDLGDRQQIGWSYAGNTPPTVTIFTRPIFKGMYRGTFRKMQGDIL